MELRLSGTNQIDDMRLKLQLHNVSEWLIQAFHMNGNNEFHIIFMILYK